MRADPGSSKPAGRVLLAEDNPANRKLAIAMLQKLGYEAETAGNGVEAVEALETSAYDAVLMDCRMPEMDGFRATAEIRRLESSTSSGRIPIIAMTADAMVGDRYRCLEAGMDDYVSKPVSFESLAEVLVRWIPRAEAGSSASPPSSSSDSEGHGAQEESPLDPLVISDLRRLEARPGKSWLPELVATFVRDAESNLGRLRNALEDRDMETVADRSHALAGSVSTIGARKMGGLCSHLKALGTRGDLEAARAYLIEIEGEFKRVRAALGAEFPASKEAAR